MSARRHPGSFRRGGRPNPHAPVEHAKDPVATLRRLLTLLKGRRKLLVLLTIPLAVTSLARLVWPHVIGVAIDILTLHSPDQSVDYSALTKTLAAGALATIIAQLAQVAQGFGTISLSNRSIREFRKKLFSHVQALPIARFDTMTHGEFMSRLTNDIDLVANTLGPDILQFIGSIIALIATLTYMLWVSPAMTAVACSTLPLTFFFGRFIVRITRTLFRQRQKKVGELNGLAEEMITGQRIVQAFCREKTTGKTFNALSFDLRRISLHARMLGGLMGPSMNLVGNLGFLLVAACGGWFVVKGTITIGVVVTFMMYAREFSRPINRLASQFNQVQSAVAGAERVFTMLDMPIEKDTGTINLKRNEIHGKITFENVSFGYTSETAVLQNFSLTVKPGNKIALVGKTGSGKTTVINLLTRFYDPSHGRILLDDIDTRHITQRSLRSSMAVVLQDTHLFSGTVAENISFGNPEASREAIIAAARLANADVFINRLPQGYDTPINQTDTALSQGQCQLLAIARAALSDPAILILDEATSNVDTRTELHIQQAMVRLMKSRTSLIIAHRLSTIRDADCILVLANGRIIESGTHETLLAQNNAYAALCKQ